MDINLKRELEGRVLPGDVVFTDATIDVVVGVLSRCNLERVEGKQLYYCRRTVPGAYGELVRVNCPVAVELALLAPKGLLPATKLVLWSTEPTNLLLEVITQIGTLREGYAVAYTLETDD